MAVKIPVRDDEVEMGDYNKTNIGANGVTYGSTAYITSLIDHDHFINEYIDGYEAAAVPDNLVADRLDSAGYVIANKMDTVALQTLVYAYEGKGKDGVTYGAGDVRKGKKGTSAFAGTIDKNNIYTAMVTVRQKLDEADIPLDENRFAIVSPAVYALLLQDTTNFIRQGDLSQELVMKGAVGMVAGLPIYVSNKLAGLTATKAVSVIAGHSDWCTKIQEWKVEPKLVDGDSDANVVGGSFVKGRKIFTYDVTKPQTLVAVTAA